MIFLSFFLQQRLFSDSCPSCFTMLTTCSSIPSGDKSSIPLNLENSVIVSKLYWISVVRSSTTLSLMTKVFFKTILHEPFCQNIWNSLLQQNPCTLNQAAHCYFQTFKSLNRNKHSCFLVLGEVCSAADDLLPINEVFEKCIG